MEKLTDEAKAEAVRDYQRHTTGSDEWFRHAFGLLFTSGVKFVADTCGAFWLIDLIASYQHRLHGEGFQVWTLAPRDDQTWVAECWSDTPKLEGSRRLARQVIDFSDFPRELATPEPFMLWMVNDTILLPQEY